MMIWRKNRTQQGADVIFLLILLVPPALEHDRGKDVSCRAENEPSDEPHQVLHFFVTSIATIDCECELEFVQSGGSDSRT